MHVMSPKSSALIAESFDEVLRHEDIAAGEIVWRHFGKVRFLTAEFKFVCEKHLLGDPD